MIAAPSWRPAARSGAHPVRPRAVVAWYVALLGIAAAAAGLGLPPAGPRAVTALGVAGVCAAIAARWGSAADPQTRSFWRGAAAAFGLLSAWYLAGAWQDLGRGPHLAVLPPVLLAGAGACLITALVLRVLAVAGPTRGLASLADAVIVGICALSLGAPALAGPVLHHGTRMVVVSVSWGFDLVILAGLQWARVNQPAARDPRGLTRASAMLAASALLTLVEAVVDRSGAAQMPFWFVGLYGAAYLVGLDAPALDGLNGRPPQPQPPGRAPLRLLVPFAAAAVVTAVALAAVAAGDESPQARVVVAGALLVGACFAVRQSLVVRDQRDRLRARSREALHDQLTGLRNRRAFDRDLGGLLIAAGGGDGFAVILADLDGLKLINDGPGGHSAGDQALRAAAAALAAAVRSGDGAYRLGGDEFAVLLPGGTREAADRACAAAAGALGTAGSARSLSLSVGIAVAPGDGVTARGLVDVADRALYRAKRTAPARPRAAGGSRAMR